MRTSALGTTHVRSLALMLAVVFSFAAIGTVSVASAADASTAKKCKKGYKKVGKKCKKKKSTSSKGALRSVNLYQGQMVGSMLEIMGDFQTKSGFTGRKTVNYTIVSAAGTQSISQYALGYGRTESNFTQKLLVTGAIPFQVTAKIDGMTSNTLTVTR